MPVAALVRAAEGLIQGGHGVRPLRHADQELPRLPDVPHAERAQRREPLRRDALLSEVFASLALELGEYGFDISESASACVDQAGPDVVAPEVGDERAEG